MDSISFFPSFLKMVCALAVVVGIMIAAMYFFKKIMHQTTSGVDDGSAIKIISARYLGPKSSIVLVDVLGHIIVIGISNHQMTLLTTISDPTSWEKLKSIREGKGQPLSLGDYLSKYKIALQAMIRTGKDTYGK